VDRQALLEAADRFSQSNNLKVDWEGIESAPNEALVNALAMMSPYARRKSRRCGSAGSENPREILIAVTEMDLARNAQAAIPGCSSTLSRRSGNYSCEQPIARYAQRQRLSACIGHLSAQNRAADGRCAFATGAPTDPVCAD